MDDRPGARDDAVAALVAAGVTAAPVRTMDEVAASAHLRERGFFVDARAPRGRHPPGRRPAVARVAHADAARCARRRCSASTPTEVLREVLGMADAELAELVARGVVG